MSTWAVLDGRLLATWDTGIGRRAEVVDGGSRLVATAVLHTAADCLTELAEVIWAMYLLPEASPTGDECLSDVIEQVAQAVEDAWLGRRYIGGPGLPAQAAVITRDLECCATEWSCSPGFANAVRCEVDREFDALRRALLGDLSGRASQVVRMSRAFASPTQVDAADRILWTNPLDAAELTYIVEPAAAAVAASAWFAAALRVIRSRFGYADAVTALIAADQIGPLPMAVLTSLAEQIEAGLDLQLIVEWLLTDAALASKGWAPTSLLAPVGSPIRPRDWPRADERPVKYSERICTLSPRSAGRDLAAMLRHGIRGCGYLYAANALVESTGRDSRRLDAFHSEFIGLLRDERQVTA